MPCLLIDTQIYIVIRMLISVWLAAAAQMSIHALLNWRGDAWYVHPKAIFLKGTA